MHSEPHAPRPSILAHLGVFGAALLALVVGAHGYGAEGAMGSTLHAARAYDWVVWGLTLGGEARLREAALDPADLGPGDRVLDVCCGTGTLALAAAERVGDGGRVIGVDASAEMIERASGKASGRRNVAFQVATAQALPFPDGSFEAVFCTLGLHHVPVADRAAALREMQRVLVPGGRVVIVEFDRTRTSVLSPASLLHRRHQPDVLREAATTMAEVGFDEVEVGRRQVSPRLRVAFEVEDAEAVTDDLVAAGAELVAPPTRTPWSSLNARLEAPASLQLTIFQELE